MLNRRVHLIFQAPSKVLLAVCLAFGPLFAMAAAITDETLAKYSTSSKTMDTARTLFNENRLPESEMELKKCITLIPDHHEANFFLSQIWYQRQEFQKALGHIALATQSLNRLEDRYLGLEARKRKLVERRIIELQHTVDTYGSENPNCMTATVDVARNSISELEKGSENNLDPREVFSVPAEYHFVHGNCLFRLGRHDAAIEQYLKAIQADPKHSGSWNNLVSTLLLQQKLDQAKAELKHAEDLKVVIQPKLKAAVSEKK